MAQQCGAAPSPRISRGAPGPRGPTPWLRRVPGSHDRDPGGQASKHHFSLCYCYWQAEPSFPETRCPWVQEAHAASHGTRSRPQGPQCCPAATANRKSTHRPQNLRDKLSGTQLGIGKPPLSPSQEGWGGHVSRETICQGPPSASVGAPYPQGCHPRPLSHQSPAQGYLIPSLKKRGLWACTCSV